MLELVKGGNKYLLLNGNSCSTQLMASLPSPTAKEILHKTNTI